MFLVKDTCTEYCENSLSIIQTSPEAPEGYIWACAERKKDIEWDAMRRLANQKAEETFHKYERIFRKGKTDDSSLEEYGIPENRKYPVSPFSIVDTYQWVDSEDNIDDSSQDWHRYVEQYIDGDVNDDTVIAVVDYHQILIRKPYRN